jgi:hypothetical protein
LKLDEAEQWGCQIEGRVGDPGGLERLTQSAAAL